MTSVELEPPWQTRAAVWIPHSGDTTYLQVPDAASYCLAAALGAEAVTHLPEMDPDSIPGSGRCLGEQDGYPLQYSCLENPMDRGAWQATVHGVTKSQTPLSTHTHRGKGPRRGVQY